MFYLIPPKSVTNLSTLEKDIETRVNFIVKVYQLKGEPSKIKEFLNSSPNLCSNLDCLIDGSRRDCASHFIVRVSCMKSGQIQSYWIAAEKELFLYRLKCGEKEGVYAAIVKLLKDIKRTLSGQHLSNQYKIFLEEISNILEPQINSNLDFICCANRKSCNHYIRVPWTLVQEFVSKREVELNKGSAKLPCSLLLRFLSNIFEDILYKGTQQLQSQNFEVNDTRIKQIITNVHSYFLKLIVNNMHHLKRASLITKFTDVEKEVHNFPLCMQQLHLQLKRLHRLNHYERFRYSLFLKDIGLPLSENILFWKHYYSMAPKCRHSGCQHVWDEKTAARFQYGIRHTYGIEGKRVSYDSHTCSSLQALNPQPQETGGCPFKHLEQQNLVELISTMNNVCQTQQESILTASKNGNPSLACGLHLSSVMYKHIPKPLKLSRFNSCSSIVPKQIKFSRMGSLGSAPLDVPVPDRRWGEPARVSFEREQGRSSSISTNRKRGKVKQTCFDCNQFNSCQSKPEMSFLSPKHYYKLVKMKS